MDGLNQFVISRVLGSTMKHAKRSRFGPLGVLHARSQVLAQCPRPGEQISFSPTVDKRIARAFEETRQGFPLDRFLADPKLAQDFFERCHTLDIIAPQHALALRLFRFRKSPQRYPKLAKPSAPRERYDFSPYLYAAEMAISQIKYRYGASVDDMLAYPNIGKEYDQLASELCPGRTPLEYRLAALYIRKSWTWNTETRSLFDSIETGDVERSVMDYGSLAQLSLDKISNVKGIIGIVEQAKQDRFLYVTPTSDASRTVAPFTREKTFAAVANLFWTPALSTIRLLVYDIHRQLSVAPESLWAKKFIAVKGPIFNYFAAA